MLGRYDQFPETMIHKLESFSSILSIRQLQQKLMQTLYNLNCREFSFEEVANPTVPEGKVIFEFGLADGTNFNYIDEEELRRVLDYLIKQRLSSMDFFCSIRYYKGSGVKRSALKFDYYMLRTNFSKEWFEVQVFHERGPRYISPEDLVNILKDQVNVGTARKILK